MKPPKRRKSKRNQTPVQSEAPALDFDLAPQTPQERYEAEQVARWQLQQKTTEQKRRMLSSLITLDKLRAELQAKKSR